MRRKSERSKKSKGSPEKTEKVKRGRPTRRSKAAASSSSEAESVEEAIPQVVEAVPEPESNSQGGESHQTDDKVWQVKSDDSSSGTGEIKKLKICLSTRLPLTPEPESTPRGRKKLNRTISEIPNENTEEKRRGRHKRRSVRGTKDSPTLETHSEDDNSARKVVQEEKTNECDDTVQSEKNTVSTTAAEITETTEATTSNVQDDNPVADNIEAKSNITEIEVAHVSEDKNEERKRKVLPLTPINKRRRSRRLSGSSPERDSSPEPNEPSKLQQISEKLPQISEEPEQNQTEDVQLSKLNEHSSENVDGTKDEDDTCNSDEKNKENAVQVKETESAATEEPKSSDENAEKSESPEEQTDIITKQQNEDNSHTDSKTEQQSEDNSHADSKTEISQPDHSTLPDKDEQKSSLEKVDDKIHNTSSKRRSSKTNNEEATEQDKSDEFLKANRSRSNKYSSKNNIKHADVTSDDLPNHSNKESDPQEDVIKPLEPEEKKLLEPEETYNDSPIVVSRKRRWGSLASKPSVSQRLVSISTDILKEIIPDVKPVELEEAIKERKQHRKSESHDKHSEKVDRPMLPKIVIDNSENANLHRREKEKESKEKRKETSLTEHRKISIVKEDNFVAEPPSPPRNKTSSVLYITNLVRPFTLAQLKNLLQRTGKIFPEGFWIDRIKSKCFVTYENEEQAIETRHALHGVTWPVSNPKTLQVDFSSKEHMDRIRAAEEQTKEVSAIPGTVEDWLREQDAKNNRSAEVKEDLKPWDKRNLVREWDVGKGEKEKEKLKREERSTEKRRNKSSERSPEPVRKFKKKEEEPPAKMLDDLFRKTKVVPCIYWLPLSAETIAVKEEQRRQHMAEHERRMHELEHSRPHRRH